MDGNSILALSDLLNPPKEESDDVSIPACTTSRYMEYRVHIT